MFFDARAAKLLPAGQHLVIDGCPGLRLVASATRKSWAYRYKDHAGRMKQVSLGQWPAVSAQAAVAAWQALRDGKARGDDPATQRRAARAQQRVRGTGYVPGAHVFVRDGLIEGAAPALTSVVLDV